MADIPKELEDRLRDVGWDGAWIDFYLGNGNVCLDGHFTKEQLEVIAEYMSAEVNR